MSIEDRDTSKAEEKAGYARAETLAEWFGVTVRTIQRYRADGALVTEKTKWGQRYHVLKSCKAFIAYLLKKLDTAEEKQRAIRADADYKERKAEILRLELDRLQGRLLDADDVELVITGIIVSVRGAMMSLPGRLAKDLAPLTGENEVAQKIKREVTALLNELALKYDPAEFRRLAEEKGKSLANDETDDE